MAEVATKKLFESGEVIVWEMLLEPGESTGVHTHYHDFCFFVTAGSQLEIKDGDGNLIIVDDVEDGRAMQFKLDGENIVSVDGEVPDINRTHQAKNVGEKTYREVLIEVK